MQHLIRKQLIELNLGKKQDAFRMQHLISGHYRNEMLPVLEAVFDEFGREEEVLVLEKLEIDFGLISVEDLERSRWDASLITRFKEKLQEGLAVLISGKTGLRESKSFNAYRQWSYYMRHGHLNWNTLVVNDKWYNKVLESLAADESAISDLRTLVLADKKVTYRIVMQHDEIFLTKLVEVLTARNQQKLAAAFEEIYQVVKENVAHPVPPLPALGIFKQSLWQDAINFAATGGKELTTTAIAAAIIETRTVIFPGTKQGQQRLLSKVYIIKQVLSELFELQHRQHKKSSPGSEPTVASSKDDEKITGEKAALAKPANPGGEINNDTKELPVSNGDMGESSKVIIQGEQQNEVNDIKYSDGNNQETGEYKDDKNEGEMKDDLAGRSPERREILPLKEMLPEKEIQPISEQPLSPGKFSNKQPVDSPSLQQAIPGDGLYIRHAGAVLVHPFLSSLFRRLQLVEGNAFIHEAARLKAVFLVHYLATGNTTPEEFELVLCKLLCAYPLADPVPGEILFTDAELAEATDMLTALIQQWSKLQNSSINALREGFLQREGKLFNKKDTINLQVESSAIDVLLDYLPWNISIIKLPWMKELLRVEWR